MQRLSWRMGGLGRRPLLTPKRCTVPSCGCAIIPHLQALLSRFIEKALEPLSPIVPNLATTLVRITGAEVRAEAKAARARVKDAP